MKRLLAVVLAVIAVVAMAVTANAASGLNANENEVLKVLREEVLSDLGTSFTIPEKYIQSAENYFKGDYEMTVQEKDTVIALLRTAQTTVKNEMDRMDKETDGTYSKKDTFQLRDMEYSKKKSVLQNGIDAAAEAGLDLVYVWKTNHVVITKPADPDVPGSKPVLMFENAPLIKTTGETVTTGNLFAAIITLSVVGSAAVLFVVAKKKGLLVK